MGSVLISPVQDGVFILVEVSFCMSTRMTIIVTCTTKIKHCLIFTLPVFSATMNIRKNLTFNFPTSDKRYVIFGSGSGVIWNFFIGFSLSIFRH